LTNEQADLVFRHIFPFEADDGSENKINQLKHLTLGTKCECDSALIRGLHSLFPQLSTLKHKVPNPLSGTLYSLHYMCQHSLNSTSSSLRTEWVHRLAIFKCYTPLFLHLMDPSPNVDCFFKYKTFGEFQFC